MTELEAIQHVISQLYAGNEVSSDAWPPDASVQPADLGIAIEGLHLKWIELPERLDSRLLQSALAPLEITHHNLIDSTNTQLVTQGQARSVHQCLHVAEFQFGGRGRRGRAWISPYARNLAMSLGLCTQRSLPQLGGLSIVVGLAMAEVFEELGLPAVSLKWPNDIFVENNKLCGILVELVHRDEAVEYVLGMGVNVSLTDAEISQIEQPVTDLRRHGVEQTRTQLAIALVKRVCQYMEQFEVHGFPPFVSAFNDLHKFHGQTCTVRQGDQAITGIVSGIGEQGELILNTQQGEQRFHGGEVSLRAKS